MTVVKLSERAQPKNNFDEFWAVYPKRVGKGHARKSFAAACKVAQPSEIIMGAMRFADHVRAEGTAMQYIPYPSTWLNGERWEDELHSSESNWGDWDEL